MRLAITCLLLAGAAGAAHHKLPATPRTVAWGYYASATPPVLRIQSGDTVEIETLNGNPQRLIAAGLAESDIPVALLEIYREVKDRGPGGHLLTGPIFVEGAEPGDVLEVRILKIAMPVAWSANSFRPGSGFLPDDFPFARLRIIPLDRDRMVARFAPGVEVPLRPFFGSMGVAPPEVSGRINSGPPWVHAGNLDNRELTAGARLFIPVHAPGALFQVGDGHGAQGNGEVDLTALEMPLNGVFEFHVRKGKQLRWPRAETATHFISMGLHEDLTEAARLAVRDMIDFLVTEKGLSREDAYMLTSVAIDLNITQLVDGNKGVHALCPKALFPR